MINLKHLPRIAGAYKVFVANQTVKVVFWALSATLRTVCAKFISTKKVVFNIEVLCSVTGTTSTFHFLKIKR